jgi:ATP-dependent RNA helicase RhlE
LENRRQPSVHSVRVPAAAENRSAAPGTRPPSRFEAFGLRPELERAVADLGFTEPTPIQSSAIPPALAGRDVLACAMTGSGKTAAFMLPLLERLAGMPRGTTRVLVLAPTRELAAQIVEHANALARHTRVRAAAVHGGVSMLPQERAFRTGVDIIVACPGRLLDHMQHAYAKLAGIEVLVLDEADRMLDMGFLPDIRRVLDRLPPRQQTMLFSATLPREIQDLARRLLVEPATIDVERPSAPATGVTQAIYEVRHDLKPHLLLGLLEGGAIANALVFTRTKHRANRLADFLDRRGVSCERIHGNRSQGQRTKALEGFKNGLYRVLVATDVAARGIDVEALSHVVNFDVPNLPEDYIHRVGRTARAGATGEALTFASREESDELRAIERRVGKPIARRRLEGFDYEHKPAERFEIPAGERIAAHRARNAEARGRSRARAERGAHAPAGRDGRAAAVRHQGGPARAAAHPAGTRDSAQPAATKAAAGERTGFRRRSPLGGDRMAAAPRSLSSGRRRPLR